MKNKNQQKSNSLTLFLGIALVLSVAANIYFTTRKAGGKNEVLATLGSQKFLRSSVSEKGEQKLHDLDLEAYATLKKEAELWAGNIAQFREAQLESKTADQIWSAEVVSKVQVTDEMVYDRYAHSPSANMAAYPQVLKDIETGLRDERIHEIGQKYLEGLYKKYDVHFLIPAPSGYKENTVDPVAKYPVYVPKPALPDVVDGKVVAPAFEGSKDAPVVIEIFSDFMCPFSARFAQTTLPKIRESYKDNVRVEYRHFPLPFHQGSELMSQAALCSQEQGKFWEYHDALLLKDVGKKEKPELVKIAQDLKLNEGQFVGCLDSGRYKARMDADIELGKKMGAQGTPTFYINGRQSVGATPFESVKPIIDWMIKPQGAYPGHTAQAPTQGNAAPGSRPDPNKIYDLPADWLKSGPSRGPEKASVTLVENLDYQCPFCKKGTDVITQVLQRYGDKIRIISKQFPLPMHSNAFGAAQAALCADEQGKYWEFREEAFGPSWEVNKDTAGLKGIAKKLKLDEKKFNACLDSEKYKDRVQSEVKAASSVGVQGTPSYFINGSLIVGAQPVENFSKIIDDKLSKPTKAADSASAGKEQKHYQ